MPSDVPDANGEPTSRYGPTPPEAAGAKTEIATTAVYEDAGPQPAPSTQRRLPAAFGRYQRGEEIAKGGHGTVFIAKDSQLQRTVALKVPHEKRMQHPGAVEQFLAEASHLAHLKHPGIVTVYDVGIQDGLCYIVTDYVNGTTLEEWLKRNRPDWPQTAKIVAAVADALAYTHAKRIVHRDVKPSNIVLDADLSPILIDFGLALAKGAQVGGIGQAHAATAADHLAEADVVLPLRSSASAE